MTSSEIKNRTVYVLCRTDKPEDGTNIYRGSTSRPMKERLRIHRKDSQKLRNGNNRLYKRMVNVGIRNWKVIPLVTFACDQKTTFEFEKQWIVLIGADSNTNSPITDRKEYKAGYYLENKEAIRKRPEK